MNVDCRWLGTSAVRFRVLAAGLVLLGAGCAIFGWGSRSRQTAANTAALIPANNRQAVNTLASASPLSTPAADAGARARSLFAGLPLMFEPNQGQGGLDASDSRARFVTRGSGYALFLGTDGATLSLTSSSANPSAKSTARVESLQMKLAGANPKASLSGSGLLPGKSNYFVGNDPTKWRTNIPQFARVRYEQIYPGIDLVFYGNQGHLEYDFQVAPGSDPAQAELEFNGAKKLEVSDGALVVKVAGSSVRLDAPRVYQKIDGREQLVRGSFVLRGDNRAGFAIGPYDHSRELVIDPILNFSTYFGGSGNELATSVAVDGSLNIYIAGSTMSSNLPANVGAFQTTLKGVQNVYVAKIIPPLGSNPASLSYVTYLGGSGTDAPVGIGVDAAGDAFVAGTTSSPNFPTTATNAYQSVPEAGSTGTSHVFVSELNGGSNPASTLLYSSYLSGSGTDIASGMTIDASGDIYVTGTTTSQDVGTGTGPQFPSSSLPYAQPFQSEPLASIQFFVTKVNTFGSGKGSIGYSTYFGGANAPTTTPIAVGGGIAVDTNHNIYFTGTTNFTYTNGQIGDFPILNAYQPCLNQAPPTTTVNPPICGSSTATGSDAFVAKLNPNANQGPQLVWSTYLGGSQTDSGTGIALDSGAANVYVTGTTNSQDFVPSSTLISFASYQKCLNNLPPTTTGTVTCTTQTDPAPNDAFVARLSNPTGGTTTTVNVVLNYFSYLGGSGNEAGNAVAVDSGAGAILTGWTRSTDFPVFPVPNSIQGTLNGTQNAFLARLNSGALVGQTTTASWANYFGGNGVDEGTGVTLDINQNTYLAGDSTSTNLQVVKELGSFGNGNQGMTNSGGSDAFVTQFGTAVSLTINGVLTGTNQTFISAGNAATFTYTVTNNGPDLASGITITDNLSATGVPLTPVTASIIGGTCSGVSTTSTVISCSLPTLQAGSTATVTIVLTPTASSTGAQASFNGGTVQAMGPGNIVYAQTSVSANMSDFKIQVTPSNFTVAAAGGTAQYNVQLTPNPVYTGSISLACTGLPTGAACTFTTNPVTLQGPGSSTLYITTTARPIVTPAASMYTRRFYAVWLTLPGLTLLGAGIGGNRRRRRILGVLMLCTLFALLLLQPACSKSTQQPPPGGTPSGTTSITVTATSGSDAKSAGISLTVP